MEQYILAIDDEPHMLKLLERIITEKTPYKIASVSNSLEVPDLLNDNQFDLIITDLKMPGMDGIDILRHVKESDRSEEVIIMTAFGSMDTALDALSKGVFDYITKPFKKEQIIFTIDRAMRWQRVKRESARLTAIYDYEPFAKAIEAFKLEYINRLSSRSGNDENDMIQRSGLTREEIESVKATIEKETE